MEFHQIGQSDVQQIEAITMANHNEEPWKNI